MENGQPSASTVAALSAYFGVASIVVLVFFIFTIYIQWRIAAKAGYSGALSLLMLVPFVNVIMICLFAFSEWPIERALKLARGEGGPPMWVPPPTGGASYLPPSV